MQFIPMAAMAVQAIGSIYQGQAAGAQADAAASLAEQNARTARQQTAVREDLIRRENRRQLGEQRAAAAQSGFDPTSGSLAMLQGESAGALEYDALVARYQGTLQSLSLENDASGLRAQGKAARRTGYLNAAGSLLGGSMRDYGRYGPGFSGTQSPAPVETRGPF